MASEPVPTVFFLSDFGTEDEFAGVVHAVIAARAPGTTVIDLTHHIPPFDVRAGSHTLVRAVPHLGSGVVLGVVDPGVGTARRGICMEVRVPAGSTLYFVGPDNGLLVAAAEAAGEAPITRVVELTRDPAPPDRGATFDGRDLFAPVAAHLSLGLELGRLGPPLTDPVRLPWPDPSVTAALIRGEIIHVDRYGNLVSNIAAGALHAWLQGAEKKFQLQVGGRTLTRLGRTYGEAPPGELLALVGSHGYLEIACARGSAAVRLQGGTGLRVAVRRGG